MTAVQAVLIHGYEERSTPKSHTVYRIEIQAHVRSWQMWRRYSEFNDLNTELSKATGEAPPAQLPPKHKFSTILSKKNETMLEERRKGLENYLRAILSSKDAKWRDAYAFHEFLGIPVERQGPPGASVQFTSTSWLDEHIELQGKLRDIWADINKRDALSDLGDVASSHRSNVIAKSKLAGVLARIGTIGKALRELGFGGMSEGEFQRRTDMVARLQDDCEKLGAVLTVARLTSARPGGQAPRDAFTINAASQTDRDALLGGGNKVKMSGRIFGAPAKETEVTRPLDNVGLLQLQNVQIEQQDNQLAQLTSILQRQRHLGQAIGAEVTAQIELLDALTDDVDRVRGKLNDANRQLNRLG